GLTCYARRNLPYSNGSPRKQARMHHAVLNVAPSVQVDHINGNGLDNRKANLRIVTSAQNCMNRQRQRNAHSQFKGVRPVKGKNSWRGTIKAHGKYLQKQFRTEIEAARWY